ncbi:MAG: LytR/AlgR family response regulator transcription factor [Saprospiraceae bacterium]
MDKLPIIQCVVVEDDQLGRALLADLIQQEEGLELLEIFKNTTGLRAYLANNSVDVLFLDIQMPGETGIDFLKATTTVPKIVLTTAYAHYAVESYYLKVLDYLLKPITEERFKKSVLKIKQVLSIERKAAAYELVMNDAQPDYLHIKSGAYEYKIPHSEIELLEASSEYIKYWTKETNYLVLGSLKKLMKSLPAHQFVQVHRSFIVPIAAIKGREKYNLILKNGKIIPIGKTYRQQVLSMLSF